MNLAELCEKIGLFPEVTDRVLQYAQLPVPQEWIQQLLDLSTAPEAFRHLQASCPPENNGLDLLCAMLLAALHTHERYSARGIEEKIFLDTMGCFSRFVREHRASFGFDGFDRGFWAYRQLSMVLFRVGALEYELRPDLERIHLHIPSDADLSLPACASSLEQYQRLTEVLAPGTEGWGMELNSWLLSPALRELLPPESRIRQFQSCFRVYRWDQQDSGCLQWVFGRRDLPLAELPEATTLQRNMKAFLQTGGRVGCAQGTLVGFCR